MDPLLADIDPSVAEGDEEHRFVSCPLVLAHVLVHFHFDLVSSVLAPFHIGCLAGVK